MKFTDVITRLESMASAMRNGIQPINTGGNLLALTKAVDMLECAAERGLTDPPEVRNVQVASTFSSNGSVAAADFGYPTDADKIDQRSRVVLALSGTKGSMPPATKLCTRKHNCYASPEPCNGPQRPKVDQDIRDLHNHAR